MTKTYDQARREAYLALKANNKAFGVLAELKAIPILEISSASACYSEAYGKAVDELMLYPEFIDRVERNREKFISIANESFILYEEAYGRTSIAYSDPDSECAQEALKQFALARDHWLTAYKAYLDVAEDIWSDLDDGEDIADIEAANNLIIEGHNQWKKAQRKNILD